MQKALSKEDLCPGCGCKLAQEWPDLDDLCPRFSPGFSELGWRMVNYYEGARLGCPLCNIIKAVVQDVIERGAVIFNEEPGPHTRNPGTGVFLNYAPDIDRHVLEADVMRIFLADPDDAPRLKIEPYTRPQLTASSAECFRLARTWLAECRQSHAQCRRKTCDRFEYPLRLIDVRGQTPKLTVFSPEQLEGIEFVALSHCWGKTRPLQTLTSNIDSHSRVGMEYESLPNTFRDAVDVTRNLAIQYVWIDSLCIIQDDSKDWEQQSSQMASVYGNSELVLAAASAGSTREGFLRKPRATGHLVTVKAKSKDGPSLSLRYRPTVLYDGQDTEILDTRGWTLQERLSARRYLCFGQHEMRWLCLQSSECECDCSHGTESAARWTKMKSIGKCLVSEVDNIQRVGEQWRENVLKHYSGREFTMPADKLVAVSALASLFHAKFKTAYLAGIWKEDLLRELLWQVSETRPSDYCETFYAPSWSWVSVHSSGPWGPYGLNLKGRDPVEPAVLAQVLEAVTVPSTTNRFGSVSEGLIRLLAVVLPAMAPRKDGKFPRSCESCDMPKLAGFSVTFYFDTPLVKIVVQGTNNSKEKSVRRRRPDEPVEVFDEDFPVVLVPLLFDADNQAKGLILGRSMSSPGCFERLGTFDVSNYAGGLKEILVGTAKQEVSIV